MDIRQPMFSARRMNALGLILNLSYQLQKENSNDYRKRLIIGVSMVSPETCFFSMIQKSRRCVIEPNVIFSTV